MSQTSVIEAGFVKGNGGYLPKIDTLIVALFSATNKNFWAALLLIEGTPNSLKLLFGTIYP